MADENSLMRGGEERYPKTKAEDSDEEEGNWCFAKDKNEDDHDVGQVPHHCTDLVCLALFIATMAGYGMILNYARENGDMRRLYHGYDFLGGLCGLDNQTSKPFLFYCKNDEGMLDLQHPICRETCPTNQWAPGPVNGSVTAPSSGAAVPVALGEYSCYWKMETENPAGITQNNITTAGLDIQYSDQSFRVETSYLYRLRDDYPTFALAGAYCMPSDTSSPLFVELQSYLQDQPMYKVISEVRSIENSWSVLLAVAGLAVVLGFLYLFLLEHCAKCLVYSALMVLIGSLLGFGGYAMYVFFTDSDGIDDMPGTGDRNIDLAIGICSLIVGGIFLVITICCNEAIQTAIGVIEATSECMMTMRSLFIEPIVTVFYKTLVFGGLMAGFALLLSCGDMSSASIEQYASMTAPGAPSGVLRSFTYSDEEYKLILLYIFIIYWVLELANATSQFVLAYIVQSWYFTPYEGGSKHDIPNCTLITGYLVAWMYHMGSLAYGSFIIAVTRLVRLVLSQIVKQAKGDGNQALACVAAALGCCVYCFQKCMEFINKNAYMDIAVNSNNFCTAAYNAFWFIVKSMPEIATLNGACWIFMIAGVGGITSLSCYITFMAVGFFDVYTNPTSEWYVSDKIMVTTFGGFIAFLVSYSFMTVFDMVADTILFCFVVEKNRRNPSHKNPISSDVQYAPEILDNLAAGTRSEEPDSE